MNKSNESLAKLASEKIIELIKDNHMEPGDRLKNEYELAQDLNVGRGTIREAIKILVSRNILQVRQGSGTFVSEQNGVVEDPLGLTFVKDQKSLMMDVLEVRLIIEPEIAAMAASNANEKQIQRLVQQCEMVRKLIESGDDYKEADILFHKRIAECSGNSFVDKLVPVINSSINLNIVLTKDKYRKKTVEEHKEIVKAIINRDVNGAKYAMITHLNTSRKANIQECSILDIS